MVLEPYFYVIAIVSVFLHGMGKGGFIGAGSFGFTTQASQADRTARNFRPLPNVGLVLIAEAVKRKVIVTPINS